MISRWLFTILSFISFFTYAQTPSNYFLQRHPIASIKNYVYRGEERFDFKKFEPLFAQMMQAENDQFFGYHASTSHFRVFQDIVRVVLEELAEFKIPDNFHFMRIPGSTLYDTGNVKTWLKTLLEQENDHPREFKLRLIDQVLLVKLQRDLHINLSAKDLDQETVDQLYRSIKKSFTPGVMYNPGYTPLNELSNQLERLLTSKYNFGNYNLKNYLNQNISQGMPLDMYGLDPDLSRFLMPYNDFMEKGDILISLNIPLFGNYNDVGNSSIHLFANNLSVSINRNLYIRELEKWFNALGIDPKQAYSLLEETIAKLPNSPGIMLQFFADNNLLDQTTYVAYSFGMPVLREPSAASFIKGLRFQDDQQLRMLANNQTSLNPFSGLVVKRYDTWQPNMIANYMADLRSRIRNLRYDTDKLQKYKNHLSNMWQLE